MDVGQQTLELLKRLHAELAALRREQESVHACLSYLEQHHASAAGHLAGIRSGLGDIRSDVSQIKRRLDLVDA